MPARRFLALCLLLGLFLTAGEAQAQLFGARTLRGPLSRGTKPGANVGEVSGAERFVRGNRGRANFVGSDSRDRQSFVGSQQGSASGRVRAATEDLRRRPRRNNARLNPPLKKRRANEMYYPKLVVGFGDTARSGRTVESTLDRHFRAVTSADRFGAIEVSVEDRTATLRGIVDTAHEKSLAEALALFEPGIEDVRNEIVVNAPQ